MGRDWLSMLKSDWGRVRQITLEPVNKLDFKRSIRRCLMVIWEGTIKGVTAHLKLKKKAVPKFFRPRPVPFALKEKIAGEP